MKVDIAFYPYCCCGVASPHAAHHAPDCPMRGRAEQPEPRKVANDQREREETAA